MNMVAGIDISKDHFDIHIDHNSTSKTFKIPATAAEMKKLARQLAGADRVLMEATGTYHIGLAQVLFDAGIPVVVLNPKQAHHFAKSRLSRNKTDRVDARILAEMAKDPSHRLWKPAPNELRELQGLLRVRESLVKEKSARQAQAKTPEIGAFEKGFYEEDILRLKTAIKAIEKQILSHIQADEKLNSDYQRLVTVPGIGLVTASTTLAILPRELINARQASAFAGLNPRRVESGQMKGQTRLSKNGNSRLRRVFGIAAWSAAAHPGPLKDFYESQLKKGKPRASAMMALANKLLRIAYAILKSESGYCPTHLTRT